MWNDMQFILTYCNAFQTSFFLSDTIITAGNQSLEVDFFKRYIFYWQCFIEGNLVYNISIYLLWSYQYITFCLKFPLLPLILPKVKVLICKGNVTSLRTVLFRRFKGQWSAGKWLVAQPAVTLITVSNLWQNLKMLFK